MLKMKSVKAGLHEGSASRQSNWQPGLSGAHFLLRTQQENGRNYWPCVMNTGKASAGKSIQLVKAHWLRVNLALLHRLAVNGCEFEGVEAHMMTDVQTLFKEHCIIPDVINIAPAEMLTIKYPNGTAVETGKELTPTQVKDQPTVSWAAKEAEYYTLAMVDPDAPSRDEPKFREWHHWLIGNIQGSNIGKGEVLSEYIGSGPPKGTGLHRYVFLVYKQPEKLDFSKINKLPNNSGEKRGKFSIGNFAQKFKLGSPVAGNFYVAKYDDYVPKLYAKLKG